MKLSTIKIEDIETALASPEIADAVNIGELTKRLLGSEEYVHGFLVRAAQMVFTNVVDKDHDPVGEVIKITAYGAAMGIRAGLALAGVYEAEPAPAALSPVPKFPMPGGDGAIFGYKPKEVQ